jgi:hypothetical protein
MKSINIYKKYFTLILLFAISVFQAQVGILKTSVDGSGLLDFPTGTTNGIILPSVSSLPASPSNGTLLASSTDNTVKMYVNGNWQNLADSGNVTAPVGGDSVANGVTIGAPSSTAVGVLVLESSNKALILPK